MNMISYALLGVILGISGVIYAVYLAVWVLRQDPGNEKMRFISQAIATGARAYLFRQYRTLAVLLVILAVLILVAIDMPRRTFGLTALAFIVGALGSMLAGYLGMYVTTRSASRVAQAAATGGMGKALLVSWRAGAVMGLSLASIALLLISGFYLVFRSVLPDDWAVPLVALGFGASLVTLFMRVGGGIYTKAADLGADLVGKVEAGIPEDDPRNPGVIADNVGDNVGDVAGMAADVYESYIVTVTAAIFLAAILGLPTQFIEAIILFAALALVATFAGVNLLKTTGVKHPLSSISLAIYATIGLSVVLFFIGAFTLGLDSTKALALAATTSLGAVIAPLIVKITDYYTSYNYGPVRKIAEQAKISPATVIITGYGVGLMSAIPVIAVIVAVLGISYMIGYYTVPVSGFGELSKYLAGIFGTAMASVGLLVVAGIIITADSYGPVSDNAGGVVEMAGLPDEVREITDVLDSVGNTTKATTKGYAIASAALAALVLFIALIFEIVYSASKILGKGIVDMISESLSGLQLINANVLIGAFLGVALVYFFSSRTLEAVGRTAMEIVEEIRRQFREKPGILEWKEQPDYARVVDIATRRALGEFLIPGLAAIVLPLITGLLLGWNALAGLIMGAIVAGVPRALLMANAGGAWDNAKKYIEIQGLKKTEMHKAAVIGDTVGDPMKDTVGPSLNPLIKVLNTLSVVFTYVIVSTNIALGIWPSGLLPF
ncbi:vacuolar-type H+-pyrophosphatase [Pyrobaculum aerophilum str. IM2]|uniref:K(+)-insensitive pyrophosphate-energized proton pump n=1 Tax=Pyrobaculum aerophilum (strain ATCC 51768 / DSM 7523 / JCM 9630 / CIP 104966 / NBRC 100827 / IM2) TaxID=178306 RepID=HPPA_PYRAE|nr:RecName: Full=K(+)-insensitive pyrophosphate-energized proton pump; AltName: Full=Membrane-bound proton-translocating pyrophosphatase; AltName: Full=Pyrophosphate-energized inorganic pyrophosphatase; Short=H(+)-PPase [Pyrobaculum aerophilum str. IM2]AAL63714.1 vacuolar-type H+-pyrophosphatase [Pyrobaculum aerophilum str. IM2]